MRDRPNQDFAVRRRLARVFSVCVSQRAADGVLLGLEDLRFEVRFQCGRSLAAIFEKNPRVRIDKDKVFEVVRREVAVGRPVWDSHRLLDNLDVGDDKSFVDQFVKDRANQSLAHVFTLLSLVLPTEPLQIAFRGLQTDDQNLRGTALEYLEGVLPPTIRERLWPYLEDHRSTSHVTRAREEILADLLRSNQSIVMSLEELKRQTGRDRDELRRSAEGRQDKMTQDRKKLVARRASTSAPSQDPGHTTHYPPTPLRTGRASGSLQCRRGRAVDLRHRAGRLCSPNCPVACFTRCGSQI